MLAVLATRHTHPRRGAHKLGVSHGLNSTRSPICVAAIVATLGTVLALAACGGQDAEATGTGAPAGKLVYEDTVAGRPQLFTVGADGRDLRQLTHLPGEQRHPQWSPDGTRIVFARAFETHAGIYVINADGSHLRQLSAYRFADEPAFSPDGKSVVFTRDETPREDGLTILAAAGGRPREITTNPEHGGPHHNGECGCDGDARFTPDGKHIVFKRTRHNFADSALFIVGVDGGGLHRLTEWKLSAGQPRISPDGKRLAYSVNSNDNGIANVFVMDLAGGGHRVQLTRQGKGGGTGLNAWSPDGRYLSITTDRANGHAQIWIMRADGSEAHSITPHATDAHQADWAQ